MAWYRTLITVVLHSTFDHLLQGFRIHVALHGLSQALGKGRGEELTRCIKAPALVSCWTQIQPLLRKSAQLGVLLMSEGSPCQSWPLFTVLCLNHTFFLSFYPRLGLTARRLSSECFSDVLISVLFLTGSSLRAELGVPVFLQTVCYLGAGPGIQLPYADVLEGSALWEFGTLKGMKDGARGTPNLKSNSLTPS